MKVLQIALNIPVDRFFSYLPPENFSHEFCLYKRVKIPFGKSSIAGYVAGIEEISESLEHNSQNDLFDETKTEIKKGDGGHFKLKKVLEIIDREPVINDEFLELAKYMSQNYLCSIGESLSSIIPPALKDGRSGKSKIFETSADNVNISAKDSGFSKSAANNICDGQIVLNADQTRVYNQIKNSIINRRSEKFLLYGVTSSGKTEVYLKIIKFVLSIGKSAVFLIPEISLTMQFSDIVCKRFGNIVGLWHSAITPAKKYRLFKAAQKGDIKIMLGARSAIFAPFKNIGVIIIDEEHEHTYKQEQKPSYDSRDLAAWRANYHNGCLILGSATPSLETFTEALSKKITMLSMPKRIDNREMPQVKILSLKDRMRFGSNLLPDTIQSLSDALNRKEQAIVFLNRRGFSPSIMCRKCQSVYQCPNCSVSMSHHKEAGTDFLKCHYCGRAQKFPLICPECKSGDFAVFGIGTQKIEDELKKLFPKAKMFRLDGDTAAKKGNYEKAYRGLKSGDFDILIGTQMIAKGFDFERVSLVCIVDADTSLYLPDFKSVEKTFQLIIQTAGRCGRGKTSGKVMVQTYHPQHYCVQYAKNYDFEGFYNEEIERRKSLFYPPFCHIAEITVRNKDEDKTFQETQNLFIFCKSFAQKNNFVANLLGPAQCYIKKLNNFYRMRIILKGQKDEILKISKAVGDKYQKIVSSSQIIIEIMPTDLI